MATNTSLHKLRLMCVCVLGSVLTVFILYALSDKVNDHPNGFRRIFTNISLIRINELALPYNSYYIAGLAKEHFYLANSVNPFHLIAAPYALTDTLHLKLQIIDRTTRLPHSRTTVSIDSPAIHLMENTTPAIYSGSLPDLKLEPQT